LSWEKQDPFDQFFMEFERVVHGAIGSSRGDGQEIHIDVYEMGEEVSILADIPFAKKDDVRYRLVDHHLHLDINTNGKRISRSIKIPMVCGDVTTTFKNGVLEVRLRKK